MKRVVIIGFSTVVLIGIAATGYMMITESQQKQAQCQQELKNLTFKQTQSSAQYAQQIAQLKAETKTLQEKNIELSGKLKDLTTQDQQQIEQLQKQNHQLQQANQTLKQNSDKKIAELARDLQNIQKEQQNLKKQYIKKPAAIVKKPAVKAMPAKKLPPQAQPVPTQNIDQLPGNSPVNENLSLNFPAPPNGNS